MKHLVSVGMPVYNGEKYLEQTLESLLKQSFKDFEIIICDNCSTDSTEKICKKYLSHKNIKYYRNSKNLGAVKNYKLTFEFSRSEYFRWANCDDLFAEDSIEKCLEVLQEHESAILAYPKTNLIDEKGRIISKYDDNMQLTDDSAYSRFKNSVLNMNYNNIIYGLIRTDALKKTGLIRNFEGGDLVLVSELSLYGKFIEIPEYLFYRRLHPTAHSSLKDINKVQEFFDPKTKEQIPMTNWRQIKAHCMNALKAPISYRNKIKILAFLTKYGYWKKAKLFDEVLEGYKFRKNYPKVQSCHKNL